MSATERFVFVSTMSGMIVAMVTLVATWPHRGVEHDFVLQWVKAYAIGWPVAAVVGFPVLSLARRLTTLILALVGRVA